MPLLKHLPPLVLQVFLLRSGRLLLGQVLRWLMLFLVVLLHSVNGSISKSRWLSSRSMLWSRCPRPRSIRKRPLTIRMSTTTLRLFLIVTVRQVLPLPLFLDQPVLRWVQPCLPRLPRPEVLDPALLRPGRFDRRIIVDRPDLKGRVNILKVHAKNVSLDETVDLDAIALATSGAVGSDLANMINEAAILAVKNGRVAVSQKDLFESVEVVLVGKEKKDRIMSKEERRIVSYHEVGHALVSALQKDAEPVQKITIVPRTMGALGYVMQVPEEEKYLNTKKEIDAMLVGLLAGRAAEELVFDTVTTGASNDIEKATRIARAMVTQYGMSEKFGLMGLEVRENEYLTGRTIMNCSDVTAAEVDQEVMRILKTSYEEAKRLLSENREAMDKIADYLIQKETITGKEFMRIFREVKGIPEPEEEKKAAEAGQQNETVRAEVKPQAENAGSGEAEKPEAAVLQPERVQSEEQEDIQTEKPEE